jgi:hypothetical protein
MIMGIFRLKRKTFGLIPGLGNLAKAVETGSKAQLALGAAKLGGTAAVVGGTVSAAKKLTGEN